MIVLTKPVYRKYPEQQGALPVLLPLTVAGISPSSLPLTVVNGHSPHPCYEKFFLSDIIKALTLR